MIDKTIIDKTIIDKTLIDKTLIDKTIIEKNIFIQKTQMLLEFDVILKQLALCSQSEEAAEIIQNEQPSYDFNTVKQTKDTVKKILARMDSGEKIPCQSLPAIGFLLPRLALEGTILETDEACALGLFVERGGALLQWLPEAAPDCSGLADAIFRIVDREGNIHNLPELRAIKQKIQNLNAAIKAAVSHFITDDETRHILQSTVPTQRDGRTVLAVKANFRGRIRGIVHEVSSSGQTIFLEPEIVVEKNNELLLENRKLDAEIRKIMLNLTKKISARIEDVKTLHLTALKAEILMAKARYSQKTKGFIAPDDDSGSIALIHAKHPLLANPVPIDLAMDSALRALIITGPNTGGKTVAIKTAGLLAMMNQCGLALPASEGTVLPVFDCICADIGDEQSIDQSLSTFSAHIANIASILNYSTPHSLVLLDELGSGTDPQEGSALAMAILDYLCEKNTRILATTHHSILKNYGYSRPYAENASVEFDPRTLSPTYRIITGMPGESCALEIAGLRGMPKEIIATAKNYLDHGYADVSALISGLMEKHRELDALGEKARTEESRLKNERRKTDLKELKLRQRETEIKAGLAGKLKLLLDESRKTLENLVREVREGALTREKTLKVKEFLGELARTADAEEAALEEEERVLAEERRHFESMQAESAPAGAPVHFFPGMEVFAGTARRRGLLVRRGKKSSAGNGWIVEIGSLKMHFPERELLPASPAPPPVPQISVEHAAAAVCPELNLCGMRLDEALAALRRQTDAALIQGLQAFSVIHGKGDGVLQKGVHDWLKNEASVADYFFAHPDLGGFGRTEVVLEKH